MSQRIESFKNNINIILISFRVFLLAFPYLIIIFYCFIVNNKYFFIISILIYYLLIVLFSKKYLLFSIIVISITLYLMYKYIDYKLIIFFLSNTIFILPLYIKSNFSYMQDIFIYFFVKNRGIKLFIPNEKYNFWTLYDLKDRIYYKDLEKKNHYISVLNRTKVDKKRHIRNYTPIYDLIVYKILTSKPNYTQSNYAPIYDLIICKILTSKPNYTQRYFYTIYTMALIINFIMFIAFLALIDAGELNQLDNIEKISFGILYIFYSFILFLYFLITKTTISRCDSSKIKEKLQNISLQYDIDKKYKTFNKNGYINHEDELNSISEINASLLENVKSIYTIASPLFVTLQIIILLNILTKG